MTSVLNRVDNGHNKYGEHLGYHFKPADSYGYGMDKPRYPVPSLLTAPDSETGPIEIFPDRVVLWQSANPIDEYTAAISRDGSLYDYKYLASNDGTLPLGVWL